MRSRPDTHFFVVLAVAWVLVIAAMSYLVRGELDWPGMAGGVTGLAIVYVFFLWNGRSSDR